MESKFKIGADGWYDRQDLAWRMNEYDEYGVEQAVQLKEQTGADLTVLCIGPEQVKETMKKALAMGCDRGVHIVDDGSHLKDPGEIAGIITEFARGKNFDLIFTGMQSQDRGSAQVGVMLAEMLGIAAVTTIVGFAFDGGKITVKRELEGGVKATVEAALPALITCQLGLNTPRYPTLPNIMKAKKKELLSIPVADLYKTAGLQETVKIDFPVKKGGGVFLEGEVESIADRLITILKAKTAVLA
jgi:electron transfer flavoprotein beta subunit